jgi:hypothetical protein
MTDGTLLIGLKEVTASRGIDAAGVALPVQARFTAEAAIRGAFPEIEAVNGLVRVIPGQRGSLAVQTRSFAPFSACAGRTDLC